MRSGARNGLRSLAVLLLAGGVAACNASRHAPVASDQPAEPGRTFYLPAVIIDTGGTEIPDEPKIPVSLKIFPAGRIEPGFAGSEPLYDGFAGIELRGSSSMFHPKKQYGFELWELAELEEEEDEPEYESVDAPLLDLPEESDWILNGSYVDKSLIRNPLAYELSRRMGHYASRYRWTEVVVNDGEGSLDLRADYLGVFALLEKIKRGSYRVNIAKLGGSQNSMPQVSGGYLLKIDRVDPGDYSFVTARGTQYVVDYPKADNITGPQKEWIQDYIGQFEDSLGDEVPAVPYTDLIDADSFADYFLLNELFKNVDAYRLSTYLHKDRGGKLRMGPVWDFDLGAGNCSYYDAWKTSGWMLGTNITETDSPQPFWWQKLFDDAAFRALLSARWAALRADVFSDGNIAALADGLAAEMGPAVDENFSRWRILGEHLFPNKFVGETHAEEIGYLKGWLQERLDWMDSELLP